MRRENGYLRTFGEQRSDKPKKAVAEVIEVPKSKAVEEAIEAIAPAAPIIETIAPAAPIIETIAPAAPIDIDTAPDAPVLEAAAPIEPPAENRWGFDFSGLSFEAPFRVAAEAMALDKEDRREDETPSSQWQKFAALYPNEGNIRVQTLTAKNTYPVPGATVEISKNMPAGKYIIERVITDAGGQTEFVSVPAKPRESSEGPSESTPYTTYDLKISHPKFATVIVENLSVFEGVVSLQRINMVPAGSLPDGMEEIRIDVTKNEL